MELLIRRAQKGDDKGNLKIITKDTKEKDVEIKLIK